MPEGTLFVISAPSGAGKSTLIKALMGKIGGIGFSVSHTTREPRPGEVDGVNYHFVAKEKFQEMARDGAFAEWALVHGNLYGTSLKALKSVTDEGKDVILDIDVQGALNHKNNSVLSPVLIFIMPPSVEELEKRLIKRGDTGGETLAERLKNAAGELAEVSKYDYVIINDEIERAVGELASVITGVREKNARKSR